MSLSWLPITQLELLNHLMGSGRNSSTVDVIDNFIKIRPKLIEYSSTLNFIIIGILCSQSWDESMREWYVYLQCTLSMYWYTIKFDWCLQCLAKECIFSNLLIYCKLNLKCCEKTWSVGGNWKCCEKHTVFVTYGKRIFVSINFIIIGILFSQR